MRLEQCFHMSVIRYISYEKKSCMKNCTPSYSSNITNLVRHTTKIAPWAIFFVWDLSYEIDRMNGNSTVVLLPEWLFFVCRTRIIRMYGNTALVIIKHFISGPSEQLSEVSLFCMLTGLFFFLKLTLHRVKPSNFGHFYFEDLLQCLYGYAPCKLDFFW